MEEALDQRSSVAYPPVPSTERAVTMAHRTLTEIIRVQGTSLISVVMADSKGKLVGAITFERRNELFDKEALQLAEAIAALLGPIVGLQLRANRLLAGRIWSSVRPAEMPIPTLPLRTLRISGWRRAVFTNLKI
jgi:hypothetical protein